jgi:hypothetical protein
MLKKYLPYGSLWNNKFINNTNLFKLIKSFEVYFINVKNYIINSYKIFDIAYLNNWNNYVNIPDEVFKLDYNIQLFDKMLIKLNRKINTLNGFLKFCQKLNIEVKIIQNDNNIIHCEVMAKQYVAVEGASLLEADLVVNLTGATADYNFFIKEMVRNYLEKTTIATSLVIVEIME